MKIAVSADGKDIEDNVVASFCNCDFFLIVDMKANTLRAIVNQSKGRPSEVGGIAGQLVSNEGVDAVMVSDIELEALEIFEQYGIKVYQGAGKINDALR